MKTTDDQEITFASIASRNKTSGTMDGLSEGNKQNEPIELDRGNIDEEITINKDISLTEINQVNRHTQNRPERANDKERIESYRKPLVCLIGDSISGQVAASYLGKATNSFVKKLRAPKIEDIGKHTNEVKGAKVVVIHSGINNLREKECTSTSVLTLKEAVLGLKEASPDSKFLISKAAPVGRRALEIERNIFNAEAEKSLTDTIDNNLSYIDHGNLANRGSIVKDYYQSDELHLSKDGIYQYTGNLKDAIINALQGKQGKANDGKRQTNEFQTGRPRSTSMEGRYRRDGNRDNYDRDGHKMGYRPREQRPRVYSHPKYGRYEDEKQYDSYNYRYNQSQSYGRRRRDDNDYYDTNYNDSYRRYHRDQETHYDDRQSDYYYSERGRGHGYN